MGLWDFGRGRVGERVGQGGSATCDRGGRILSQLGGFQVSEGGSKGEQRGRQKGISKGNAPCIVYIAIRVYIRKECLECVNDTSYVHIIIIIGMNVVDNLNSV